ncbi:MAG: hypothetical protein QCI82_11075 [Candidatus Thermoplasmatota archaeon]|nr:hypothetical protein [Candidatus Thermoplasmatota archaeon]
MIRRGELTGLILGMALLITSLAVTASVANFKEMFEPELQISFEGRSIPIPDDNITVLSGHHIEVFYLNITSENENEGFGISYPHFFAVTLNGTPLWCQGLYEGIDTAVPPGGSLLMDIYFEVPDEEGISYIEYVLPSGERLIIDLS